MNHTGFLNYLGGLIEGLQAKTNQDFTTRIMAAFHMGGCAGIGALKQVIPGALKLDDQDGLGRSIAPFCPQTADCHSATYFQKACPAFCQSWASPSTSGIINYYINLVVDARVPEIAEDILNHHDTRGDAHYHDNHGNVILVTTTTTTTTTTVEQAEDARDDK
jgi:hypothetical protein